MHFSQFRTQGCRASGSLHSFKCWRSPDQRQEAPKTQASFRAPILLLLLAFTAHGAQDHELLTDHLRRKVHSRLDRRLEELEQLKSPEQIRAYQQRLRAGFLKNLGEHQTEKTPLNVQLVGAIKGDGYTIEKLIYESRPNFFVTANFYRPHTNPPYPAVLVPCGHTANGKAGYQKVGLILARNGIAALIYDPVGQGERKQILARDTKGNRLPKGALSATLEHTVTGVAPILLGQSLATYRIWDGIRSIDYLVSRDDVDAAKIGCTGNSGGGLMTSYLMSLDDRIQAAAPGCYITTKRIKNDRPGPGDAEQNIFRQIADGLDHPDFLIMRAPKPTLILSATRDFVPIEGTWIAFRQAKRIYTKLGFPERVDLAEANEKHGFTQPLRVAMTRFMRRWLLGIDDAVVEGNLPSHTDAELQCTPTGQVLLLPGARSLSDLYAERAKQLRRQRAQKTLLPLLPPETTTIKTTTNFKLSKSEQVTLMREDEFPIPSEIVRPSQETRSPVLIVGVEHAPVRTGRISMTVHPRGFGKTATRPWRFSEKYFGKNGAQFFISYMLGESLVMERAADIISAAKFLAQKSEFDAIELEASGAAAIPALHAAAMEPDLFTKVRLRECIPSWQSVIDSPITIHQLENTVHGALQRYDLPDLINAIGRSKVELKQPLDAQGKPLNADPPRH